MVPLYSLMIATEPLPDEMWERIGLRERETFTDGRHLLIYGQRTADGRFAFGGRGAPYHFGSAIRPSFDRDDRVFADLEGVLRRLVPQIGDAAITHVWGGALGVPRDWQASVGLDRDTGLGLGRRLRRRRRRHHEPRRPHPRRPRARARHRADPPAVGRPRLTAVGARAGPVDRHQRRSRHRRLGRPIRGEAPARGPLAGSGHVLAHRRLTALRPSTLFCAAR